MHTATVPGSITAEDETYSRHALYCMCALSTGTQRSIWKLLCIILQLSPVVLQLHAHPQAATINYAGWLWPPSDLSRSSGLLEFAMTQLLSIQHVAYVARLWDWVQPLLIGDQARVAAMQSKVVITTWKLKCCSVRMCCYLWQECLVICLLLKRR